MKAGIIKSTYGLCLSIFLVWIVSSVALAPASASTGPYLSCPGVIHIHSSFSSGDEPIEKLAEEGRKKKLRYLIFTDHDLVVMKYGLPPFRNLISKREELPSIIQAGPQKYLDTFERLNRAQQDIVLIPGAQSSAYYYWTGNPIMGDLTAHDYRKEILLLGIPDSQFFNGLPVLHNDRGFEISRQHLPDLVLPGLALVLGLMLLFRFPKRPGAWLVFLLSLLFALNARPFSVSRFTPYDGPQGTAPFQDLIDYANKKGALTFWAHPESSYAKEGERYGPAILKTEKYVKDVKSVRGSTGFAGIYGDESTMADAGEAWDQILLEYCRGDRKQAIWTIAEADFHGMAKSQPLDTYVTVAWVPEPSRGHILDALAKGRCYSVFQEASRGLRLESFQAQTSKGETAWSGETLVTADDPVLTAEVGMSDGGSVPVKVRIIRSGQVWAELEGNTPLRINKSDTLGAAQKIYYRIEVQGQPSSLRLLSNPIFVERKKTY